MAISEENISPEEKLLRVIKGEVPPKLNTVAALKPGYTPVVPPLSSVLDSIVKSAPCHVTAAIPITSSTVVPPLSSVLANIGVRDQRAGTIVPGSAATAVSVPAPIPAVASRIQAPVVVPPVSVPVVPSAAVAVPVTIVAPVVVQPAAATPVEAPPAVLKPIESPPVSVPEMQPKPISPPVPIPVVADKPMVIAPVVLPLETSAAMVAHPVAASVVPPPEKIPAAPAVIQNVVQPLTQPVVVEKPAVSPSITRPVEVEQVVAQSAPPVPSVQPPTKPIVEEKPQVMPVVKPVVSAPVPIQPVAAKPVTVKPQAVAAKPPVSDEAAGSKPPVPKPPVMVKPQPVPAPAPRPAVVPPAPAKVVVKPPETKTIPKPAVAVPVQGPLATEKPKVDMGAGEKTKLKVSKPEVSVPQNVKPEATTPVQGKVKPVETKVVEPDVTAEEASGILMAPISAKKRPEAKRWGIQGVNLGLVAAVLLLLGFSTLEIFGKIRDNESIFRPVTGPGATAGGQEGGGFDFKLPPLDTVAQSIDDREWFGHHGEKLPPTSGGSNEVFQVADWMKYVQDNIKLMGFMGNPGDGGLEAILQEGKDKDAKLHFAKAGQKLTLQGREIDVEAVKNDQVFLSAGKQRMTLK